MKSYGLLIRSLLLSANEIFVPKLGSLKFDFSAKWVILYHKGVQIVVDTLGSGWPNRATCHGNDTGGLECHRILCIDHLHQEQKIPFFI